jgi:hypothetical protein
MYNPDPGFDFFHPRSRIPDQGKKFRIRDPGQKDSGSRIQVKKIQDPGSGSAYKNLCIVTQKIVFKLSEI